MNDSKMYQTADEEPCVHCRAGDHGDCTENYCTCDCPEARKLKVVPSGWFPWLYSLQAPGCDFRFRIQLTRHRAAVIKGDRAVVVGWRRGVEWVVKS